MLKNAIRLKIIITMTTDHRNQNTQAERNLTNRKKNYTDYNIPDRMMMMIIIITLILILIINRSCNNITSNKIINTVIEK